MGTLPLWALPLVPAQRCAAPAEPVQDGVTHVSPSPSTFQVIPSPPASELSPLPLRTRVFFSCIEKTELTKISVQLRGLVILNQFNQYLNSFFVGKPEGDRGTVSSVFVRNFLYVGSQVFTAERQRSLREAGQPLSSMEVGRRRWGTAETANERYLAELELLTAPVF